jgi:hypothetical protein
VRPVEFCALDAVCAAKDAGGGRHAGGAGGREPEDHEEAAAAILAAIVVVWIRAARKLNVQFIDAMEKVGEEV